MSVAAPEGPVPPIAAASDESEAEATADIMRGKGLKRLSPFMVPRTMSSTVSACLTNAFHIKGLSYSLASACATGSHCIGTALEQIQMGKQDIVFAGGSQ